MNNKENFKEKFLELMSQPVNTENGEGTVGGSKAVLEGEPKIEQTEELKEVVTLSDSDVQEKLKERLKERLQEKEVAKEIKTEEKAVEINPTEVKPIENPVEVKPIEKPIEKPVAIMENPLEEFTEIQPEVVTKQAPVTTNAYPSKQEFPVLRPPTKTSQPLQEISVINADTFIMGMIKTKGHVRVEGEIDGNISAVGDIKVSGKISGDLEGDNLDLNGCDVLGSISATGVANIGKDVVLRGDVVAQSIVIDGTIHGNVLAVKDIEMSANSLIDGSLTTNELAMSQGAKLSGMVKVGQK